MIFVIDRIITLQFSKMQIEIHGSLVTIQYYTKCTDPFYPKFTSKKLALSIFAATSGGFRGGGALGASAPPAESMVKIS